MRISLFYISRTNNFVCLHSLFLLCVYQFHSNITCTVLNRRTDAIINVWLTLSLALLGVATLATGGLLQVVGLGPTTTAQGVRLVPALTER